MYFKPAIAYSTIIIADLAVSIGSCHANDSIKCINVNLPVRCDFVATGSPAMYRNVNHNSLDHHIEMVVIWPISIAQIVLSLMDESAAMTALLLKKANCPQHMLGSSGVD